MTVQYTDPKHVTGTRTTDVPHHGHSATGYGGKIPTAHMLRYLGVWRRVYVMNYGNAGTAYVLVKGDRMILDDTTNHTLKGS